MPIDSLTPVICKGTIPGTNMLCQAELLLTDGVGFYLSQATVIFSLKLDPPRVICSKCGCVTRLTYRRKNAEKLTL